MRIKLLTVLLPVACIACSATGSRNNDAERTECDTECVEEVAEEETGADPRAEPVPHGVKALMAAYPDFITGFDGENLLFADGSRLQWDDGRDKDFAAMLDDTDPQDMFATAYPSTGETPGYLADPGRGRCEALFKKMYGASAAAVERNLVSVDWFGQRLRFMSVNGAADSLRNVAAELRTRPELAKYLKSAGTFYWRKVRGAQRLSAHSYGIAIDIGTEYSDYWKWRYPRAAETDRIKYLNRMPAEVVEIFRRHGFIWGGAWYHFDTMHFEFRPELLHGDVSAARK